MGKSRGDSNGKIDKLDEAMSSLVLAQAQLVENHAAFQSQSLALQRRIDERFDKIDQRFARIEAILLEHSRIFAEHGRILQALPDAVRERIGFKPS